MIAVVNPFPNTPANQTFTILQPTCTVTTGTIEITSPLTIDLTYSIDGTNYQASTTFAGLTTASYNVTCQVS